ncbi:unnamed protein product [Microthlaspi erraticum]|uniref:Uncharacterized protein n=1 Tax=Microthlaspi erraticum TaxID=1685480 RepID=A0A6D2JTX3_9BRAS|nr:unnamed protein product [Microthlaspi erraticum]
MGFEDQEHREDDPLGTSYDLVSLPCGNDHLRCCCVYYESPSYGGSSEGIWAIETPPELRLLCKSSNTLKIPLHNFYCNKAFELKMRITSSYWKNCGQACSVSSILGEESRSSWRKWKIQKLIGEIQRILEESPAVASKKEKMKEETVSSY